MITMIRELTARLRALVKSRDLDFDFQQKYEAHLSMLAEENSEVWCRDGAAG